MCFSKVAQAKVKEAARVDSRPAHLREKTKQHSGALQKIIVEAEVDKQPLRAEQEREREESTKKNPSYSFGISDDIMLLILAFLDARSLSRAGRVCHTTSNHALDLLVSFLIVGLHALENACESKHCMERKIPQGFRGLR